MRTSGGLSLRQFLSVSYGVLSILLSLVPLAALLLVESSHAPGDDLGSPGNVYVWFSYAISSLVLLLLLQVFGLVMKRVFSLQIGRVFFVSIAVWTLSMLIIHFIGVL